MFRSSRWQVVALLAVSVLIAGVLIAQDESSRKSATFYDQIQVPLVNVEVVVTDRDGVPVGDLSADDFEVLEDGRQMEITHFSAREEASAPGARADTLQQWPDVHDRDLYLVMYFDDLNVNPRVRGLAMSKLRSMVSKPLPPGVKAFIVRFNGNLHIECEPTERSEDLLAALDRVQKHPPLDFTRQGEMLVRSMQFNAGKEINIGPPPLLEEPASVGGMDDFMKSDFLPLIRQYAAQEYQRHRSSLQALTDFIRYLQGVQGRKVVVWLGSIETRAGENLYRTYEALFPRDALAASLNPMMDSMLYDLTNEFRDMIRFANSHRVSFYPVGSLVSNLPVTFDFDNQILVDGGRPGSMGPTDLRAEAEALDVLSGSTGGRTLQDNRLDLDLEQISGELRTSYSLAYRPPTPEDEKYHEITVKVKRDDVTVRHRNGYRTMNNDGRLAAQTVSAAMLGVVDNPLGIAVGFREQEARDDANYLVPVTVEIPLGELVLLPEGEQHVAQVSVASVVRDDKGRLSAVHERAYPVTISNNQLISSVEERATFVLGMVLRKGPQRVTVSVRDDYSSIVSIGYVDVVVGDETEASPE